MTVTMANLGTLRWLPGITDYAGSHCSGDWTTASALLQLCRPCSTLSLGCAAPAMLESLRCERLPVL